MPILSSPNERPAMTPKLQISSGVLKRLEKVKSQCSGCLFGVMYNGTLLILGFNVENSANDQLNFKQLQSGFPAELDLCGVVKFGLCTDAQAHLDDILRDIDVTDNPIVLHCELGTTVGLRASLFKHGQLEAIKFEVLDDAQMYNEFIYTRLQCPLEIFCAEDEASMKTALQELRVYLASGRTAFKIKNTNIFLTGGSSGTCISGLKSSARITDLLEEANQEPDDGFGSAKSKKKTTIDRTTYEVLPIKMLVKTSRDDEDDVNDEEESADQKSGSFAMTIDPETTRLQIPLMVDSLAILHRDTEALALYDILIEGLCRSIRLIECSAIEQKYFARLDEAGVPKTYSYLPDELGHFFSCVYFTSCSDDDEQARKYRKRLHNHFGLSVLRPLFRKTNRFLFKDEPVANKYLVNPHVGIKSLVKDGRQSLVSGKYTYYHYMQDRFDDNGWGCAYRSLQTLCSWFRWQGFSDNAVPDHRAIQKYLVDIGDKPASFIGSKQWIGSTEVSMCMDGFMKTQCRILRVDSGGDLAEHGPTLVRHFETQGTPIMIGGGVLAHTILGVDFNSTTGELKFLILDPHYTGADDLATVIAKKWCGWKGCDFWDKKSYYNLCMPQLPTTACV